jgi:protein-L-isoaspartate(D-aspartate) O-methyltransferase
VTDYIDSDSPFDGDDLSDLSSGPDSTNRDFTEKEDLAVASHFDPEQAARCRAMVEQQIRSRGVRDTRVLGAMLAVPRHAFVPIELAANAYDDQPLPIGEEQTISQPYMVAAMSEALELTGREIVLEIGAGSGYQTAVLSCLARKVHAVESRQALADQARERLSRLGYRHVHIHVGDGTLGWPAAAPYDAILVTAAAPAVPEPLVAQLAKGGRMVLPVGPPDMQHLQRIRRQGGEIIAENLFQCRFVPLIGQFGWSNPEKPR